MQPQNSEQLPEQPINPEDSANQNVGQPSDPAAPSVNTAKTKVALPPNKSKLGRLLFIFLAVANVITIVLPLARLLWEIKQANSGYSGTEYVGFALLPLLFAGIFVAAINILTISFYLYKHKPKRLMMWLSLIVCLLSLGYLVKFGLPIYHSYFELKSYRETGGQEATITREQTISDINSCKLIELKKLEGTPPRLVIKSQGLEPPLGDIKYAASKDWDVLKAAVKSAPAKCNYGSLTVLDFKSGAGKQEIDIQKATEILNSCEGVDFYYGDQTGKVPFSEGGSNSNDIVRIDAEHSSTGIVLRLSQGQPAAIHVADREVAQMLPIAKQARINCNRNSSIWYKEGIDKSSL